MDDDQFQGNMSVQGGNPEPENDTGDIAADSLSTETLDASSTEAENSAEEPASEMSRRMDEILGSFDDGIATEKAISSGTGKVIQGTAVRSDAPAPDFVQRQSDAATGTTDIPAETPAQTDFAAAPVEQPAVDAAPVQADAAAQVGDFVAAQSGDFAAAPVEQQPVTTDPVAASPMDIPAAPGATPVMTGVPRSNIEQAAAEQAARDAVAAEAKKKIEPKVLLGIVIAVLVIAVSAVVIVMSLNKNNSPNVDKQPVAGNADDEKPEVEPIAEETQRIGTPDHGYVSVPEKWSRLVDGVTGTEFGYSDAKKQNMVIMNSAAKSDTMTAKSFADGQLAIAKSEGMSQPQLTTEKYGSYDCYKVYYYSLTDKLWTFKYVFEAEDNRVHYVRVITPKETEDIITTVPNSWSLNQNNTGLDTKTENDSAVDDTASAE